MLRTPSVPAAVLLLVISSSATVRSQTYFVDQDHPDAADSNPGTEELPWKTLSHAADVLSAGETVRIKSGTYGEQVRPARSGAPGAPIRWEAFPGATVIVDGSDLQLEADSALFEIVGLSHLVVSGLRITNARGPGTVVGIGVVDSTGITIERNSISDTGASGILVWSSRDVLIDGNEVTRAMANGATSSNECITVGETIGFEVRGNHVHDSPAPEITARRGEGIDVKDGSANGSVHHNHVHHVPDVGIYVDAFDDPTHDIEVYANRVHDVDGDGMAVGSEEGGALDRISVYNNVVYDNRRVGLSLHSCCTDLHPVSEVTIVNNTFAGNGWSGAPAPWGGGIAHANAQARRVVIRNNVLARNLSFQVALEAQGIDAVTIDHNLIDGFRGYPGEIRGADFVEGDPRFLDESAADFRIGPTSIAVDAGAAEGAPALDFDGVSRPQGIRPDIGAFEAPAAGGAGSCEPNDTTLCLASGRFRVSVSWRDFEARTGAGSTVPFGSADSGLFWFFDPNNWEMLVKVIRGCDLNGHYWVFASATTNVEYTLTVTDTTTGATASWRNPLGTSSPAITDVTAFATCP